MAILIVEKETLNQTDRLRGNVRQRGMWIRLVRGAQCRAKFHAVVLAALVSLSGGSPAWAQANPSVEYQVKAAFLYNFAKFVEWPPESFADQNAPIVLGVISDNVFGKLLTEVTAGKSVNGRPVVVKQFKEGQDLRSCHIVFVSSSNEKHVIKILESLKDSSVLTIGETSGFIQAGGIINFFIEENKVRLEINLDAATRARVKISAKVIAVARLVPANPSKGN
jgi:hypothetical protein